jgi:hypothetical protein
MVMQGHSFQVRRAREERGAAVFVVIMAITILTAVGLFAAHSATLVDEAAGYNRLARQTQQLAELGTVTAAAELSAGAADEYRRIMMSGKQTCVANAGVAGKPCYHFDYATLNAKTKTLANESLSKDPTGTVENVIARGDVRGDFIVELTDPGQPGPVPGMGDDQVYIQVVGTTTAYVRPVGVPACSDSSVTETGTGNASVTAMQSMRAHLLIGPVQKN